MSSDVSCPSSSPYLLSVAPVFGHHLPERLQHFDAQTLLILLQQLLSVFNQPGGKRERDRNVRKDSEKKGKRGQREVNDCEMKW